MVQTIEVNICKRNYVGWQLLSYFSKLIRWQLSYSSKDLAVLVAILMRGGWQRSLEIEELVWVSSVK